MTSHEFHIAIIMDGNGRWAKNQGKNRLWGHQKGAVALKEIVRSCPKEGVRYLTVYAFSSENWKRDSFEVNGLMKLFARYLRTETADLHKEGVCLRVIGNRDRLPPSLVKLIEHAETLTQNNTLLGLQVAINYGGQDELVHAARTLAQMACDQKIRPQDITHRHIEHTLWTHPWPHPDLLIRTGGEMRLSNYLLWQLSYTELLFMPQCWPEFTPHDLSLAIAHYTKRHRQFGAILSR
jgi:undecaprenyl diphosphate synthase